jgi:UDP-N-acetylglucosamine--N-acetylmuramyl-(pentapeptide) pyrophosphoryl-undecaprenol N-acetylglucosamine transferase
MRILARRRPDVVLGAGGYVAGPMVLAARLRGIPAALTEADAHLGLANRLAAPFARRLFLAYAIPGRNGAKVRVVGRPIPVAHRGSTREEGRRRFGLSPDAHVVAVFGALAGARSLNEMAVDAWSADGPEILHICGDRDFEALRGRVDRPGYVLVPQTDHFGDALAAADLAVSRAGGTVWELAAAGTPAILVPYPYAGRPPDAQRAALRARRWCGRRPRRRGRPRPGARGAAARGPRAAHVDARVDARARAPRRRRRRGRRARRTRAWREMSPC